MERLKQSEGAAEVGESTGEQNVNVITAAHILP